MAEKRDCRLKGGWAETSGWGESASARGGGAEDGAPAPDGVPTPRADAARDSSRRGSDTRATEGSPSSALSYPPVVWSPDSPDDPDFSEDKAWPEDDVGEDIASPSSASASFEGAGVVVEGRLRFAGCDVGRRRLLPPLPREDPEPEPVTRRRTGPRGDTGHFRRNPSVDEALAGLSAPPEDASPAERAASALRAKRRPKPGQALHIPSEAPAPSYTPQQRLLLLDTWSRSGLPAGDFAALVGLSKHTLYHWKKRFDESGPAGLEDRPRGGPSGSRMPEVTKRAILMLKRAHPEYGCERISDLLARGPALPASAGSVARVLKEAGYESVERPTERHAPKAVRYERARANSLWQTDLFTFTLKRQNRRLYLVAFMDDHSRFIVGWGLFSSPSTELVVETLKSAVSSYQAPVELLTDNGPQYVTWRGHSKFREACEGLGIKQRVARPRRPQTLGKVERFWGTLWREFLAAAIFVDSSDAHARIGRFIDDYNFARPHLGLDGLTPADRYLDDEAEVKAERARRLAESAERLARGEAPTGLGGGLLTPSYFPGSNEAVDVEAPPGADPLTAGLSAAAALEREGEGHDDH